MERLTNKDIGKVCFDTWELCGLDNVCKRDCWKPTPCKIPDIVYGLAAYEETGLTPDDINKLNGFEQSQCAKLLAENAKLKAELVAAIVDLPVCCETCIHGIGPEECDIEVCYWQWRGVEVQHEQA